MKKPSKKSAQVEDGTNEQKEKKNSLASKLAEVDPEFCEFLKTEDKDLLDDLGEVEEQEEAESEVDENEELDLDDEKDDESAGEEEEGDEADEDSDGIVPMSSDEEEEEGERLPKLLKPKPEKSGDESVLEKGDRALKMSQIHEWSKGLTRVISGEVNERSARKIIDQIVAALRCAADKIKPAEKGDQNPSEGKKKKKNGEDSENEEEFRGSDDEKGDSKKRKSKTRGAESIFSKLFSYVGVREFNAVVKLCISHLIPSFLAVLRGGGKEAIDVGGNKKGLVQQAHQLRLSKSWSRLKLSLRVYIETLVDLVKYTSDESVAAELLAHLNTEDAQILVFALPATRRALVQTVVSVWSKGCLLSSKELLEQCHVLITTTIRNCPPSKLAVLYERVFRRLYRAFMAACKFNPKRDTEDQSSQIMATMKSHLAGYVLVAPVPTMAHTLAFVRIRQLCGQLRAALSAASAETRTRSAKVVLSWPFLRCIDIWTEVVSTSPEGHAVRQLVYPLTQLTIGTARLQSSPRYYPLRLHCIRFLNRLALATDTFIPTLSLILDVFSITDFNAATKTSSKDGESKVASLSNLLHFSESQLHDSGFEGGMLDCVVNELLYSGAAETMSVYAHRVAFPELSLALVVRLKKFLKVCHVPRFAERMKILLSKVEENSRWIEGRRRSSASGDIHPANCAAVRAWENEARSANPPMVQFFKRLKSTMSIASRSSNKGNKNSSESRKRKSPVKLEPSGPGFKRDKKNNRKPFRKFQKKGHQNFNKAKRVKREVAS